MKQRKWTALIAVLLMTATSAGCKKEERATAPESGREATTQSMPALASQPAQQLVAVKFGPTSVKAGADFNVQSNGQSAMWVQGENITPYTVVILDNQRMISSPKKDGKLITCLVPKQKYSTVGEYPLYLLDTKSGNKSNELKIVVK